MKTTTLTKDQWLNRFFEQTDFCRDILNNRCIAAILDKGFKSQASAEATKEAIACAVWREEI